MAQRLLAAALIAAHTVQSASAPVSHSAVGLVDNSVWDEAFRAPNATGSVRVKGFNLSAPFPGTASDDWGFTIQVRDSIRRSDGKFATGIWIQLDAPDNLVQKTTNRTTVPQDPSWRVCQGFMDFPTLRSDAETVPGSCEGVLPKECIEAYADSLARGFGQRGNRNFQCPRLDPPVQCNATLGSLNGGIGTILAAGQASVTDSGLFDYARLGLSEDNAGHDLGNHTAYDIAIRRITLVALAWGYSNTTGRTSENTGSVAASLSCLRVNQFEPGSRRLSAGAHHRPKALGLMVWVGITVMALTYV
ncbi:hypothetical protein B0T16DRAFT_461996 [Cercophora newfieldiana]|uniref:Uncharacterized protein n=1 Tax=Cercophora newfieldiana TaxID=92897 RepID=A0AA40CKN0_9PEZI|nr:hypothetical protein B0T16DRAFT_461996 [Cercophora newfieldiana]